MQRRPVGVVGRRRLEVPLHDVEQTRRPARPPGRAAVVAADGAWRWRPTGHPARGRSWWPSGGRRGWRPTAARPTSARGPRRARQGRRAARRVTVSASLCLAQPASRDRRRRRWHTRAGYAARRRGRRGSGGSAPARDRMGRRPALRSRVRGRLDRSCPSGGGAPTGPGAAPWTTAGLVRSTGPRAASGARRTGEGLGVGGSARVALTGDDAVSRRVARRAADQAQRVVALACQRSVVGVVQAAERLVVGGEVAARVVRAAPEHVAGPPGPARNQVTVLVLGAGHLERQRIRRRRAVLLDVVAVRDSASSRRTGRTGRACRRACPRRTSGRPRRSPPGPAARRPAAAGFPCARDTASRPGTGRCAPAG